MATTKTKIKTLTARARAAEIKRLDRLNVARDDMRRMQLEKFTKELARARTRKNYVAAFVHLPWDVFARYMPLLSPQSAAVPMEYWLRYHHGWDRVAASVARGDASLGGIFKEIKASIITLTNPTANFVQLRLNHDIDEYHLFVMEPDYTLRHFVLSHAQMENEVKLRGGLAHGTKAKNSPTNPDAEWELRLLWSKTSPLRTQFIKDYQVGHAEPDTLCC
jgi:hypothetical protein